MYLKLITEGEAAAADHAESDEDEAAMRRTLARIIDEENVVLEDAEAQAAAQEVEICSCGNFTCAQIVRFGLPIATFKEDIEPLFPQHRRDERALQIREG